MHSMHVSQIRDAQMEIQLWVAPEFKGNVFTMTLTRHIHDVNEAES